MAHIDPRALVSPDAELGEDVAIWAFTQVREDVSIGAETSIGTHTYVDAGVVIGNRCKIQSGCLLYRGVVLGDGVFVGPGVVTTNDLFPRAVNSDGSRKSEEDWELVHTKIGDGASIGARSVIVAGIEIGERAFVAAGSVVTRDVPPGMMAIGVPAKIREMPRQFL